MGSKYMPDYEKYTLYELVDVYRRIDKKRHPVNVRLIEEQIKLKMNLHATADLDDKNVQLKFDEIISENDPFIVEKEKEREKASILKQIQFVLFFSSLVLLSIFLIGNDISERIVILAFGMAGLAFVMEIIQSFFTGEISLRGMSYDKENQSFLFGCMQIVLAVLGIIYLFAFIIRMFS